MKKLSLIVPAMLIAAASFAQTTPDATPAVTPATPEKAQMNKLRAEIRAYNNKKAEAKTAMVKGDMATAKTYFAAAKADKEAIKADKALLKSEGVAHPLKTANKEIRREDNKAVKTDIQNIIAAKAAKKQALKAGDITAAQADQVTIKADKMQLKADLREAQRDDKKHMVVIAK